MLRPLKSCDADPELKSLSTLEDKNRVIDQRIRAATALFAGPMPEAGAELNDGHEDIMDIGRWYRKVSNHIYVNTSILTKASSTRDQVVHGPGRISVHHWTGRYASVSHSQHG